MNRNPQSEFDVLVVGGGPAGIAAAVRAAECGVRVGIVDDNPAMGGQIWRGTFNKDGSTEASGWFSRLNQSSVTLLCGTQIFGQPEPRVLFAEGTDGPIELRYKNLILATGARERFLPFPGWTLPNVMGAGGLQAMVKGGLRIRGKRVVIAGTGPLLLAVAAYLRKQGAIVPIICEQASWTSLVEFSLSLIMYPRKITQAFQLKRELAGIPLAMNCWPVAADGEQSLESVTVSRNGKLEQLQCDHLACGFHLVPNTELPQLLGCRLDDGYVQVDGYQQTTVESVFCAGEPTSIGGVELSLVEGEIAGLAAAGQPEKARELFPDRERARRFSRMLARTFGLRPELRNLPAMDTIICRCEDVSCSQLRQHSNWRSAKLHTRCGMGACQGRVCGPALQFLFRWSPDSVRPPVFPVRVGSLAGIPEFAPVSSHKEA
jgi:NADPH-dependent 2,4-dienoyl-CoA reductase/sulfur reductase-like enzyme